MSVLGQRDALTNKYAWLVPAKTWERLHYVPGITFKSWETWWNGDEEPQRAVCGLTFDATLPGMFSRMGLPRCAHCCDSLQIPRGDGCPVNDSSLKPKRKSA